MYEKATLKIFGWDIPTISWFLPIFGHFWLVRMTNDIKNLFSISEETSSRFYCLHFFWKVWITGPLGLNVSPKDFQFFPSPGSVHCWKKKLFVLIRPHPWVCLESRSKKFQCCYLIWKRACFLNFCLPQSHFQFVVIPLLHW